MMMQLKKMKLAGGIILLSSFIFSCDSSADKKTKLVVKISPPVPELALAYTEFEVDAQQLNTFHLPSGTQLTVYPNTLVDASGALVQGKATLQYREYHDAVDVFFSGIPMNYDQGGQSRTMQTAGMFDIQCHQKGQQVGIKKGSGLLVDFASRESGIDYNFFRLDSTKGWAFVDYVAPKGSDKTAQKKQMERLRRQLKKRQHPYFIFGFRSALDVKYDDNWNQIEANLDDPKLLKKLMDYQIDLIGQEVYQTVQYKGKYIPAGMMIWKYAHKKAPSWLKKRSKDDNIQLNKIDDTHYELMLNKANGKVYKTNVRLVVPLKYIFEYSVQEWKNNIAKVLLEIDAKEEKIRLEMEALRKRIEQQEVYMRSFEIQGFGIYNYDKLLKEDDKIEVLARFEKTDKSLVDMVYCFPKDNKTLIKYPKNQWNKVLLLPDDAMRFICIDEEQSIAVYEAEQYQQLDFEALRAAGAEARVFFELQATGTSFKSADDMRAMLNEF